MKRWSFVLMLSVAACSGSASEEDTQTAGALANGDPAAAAAPQVREVRATSAANLQKLSGLWGVTPVKTADRTTARIYELGGGDPALNGDYVWVSVSDAEGHQAVWDTGLNVSAISEVSAPEPGALRFSIKWDTMNANGDQGVGQGAVTLRYTLSGGKISPSLTMSAPADLVGSRAPTDGVLTADASPEADLLGRVYGYHKTTASSAEVRVFEVGGGDPAMNGDHLYVSVMNFPEEALFDLGSDFATVKELKSSGQEEVTLTGTSDTMDGDGQIKPAPFTAKLAFDIDARTGKVGPTMKVTRQ